MEARIVILTIKICVMACCRAALLHCASRFKAIEMSYCGKEGFFPCWMQEDFELHCTRMCTLGRNVFLSMNMCKLTAVMFFHYRKEGEIQ